MVRFSAPRAGRTLPPKTFLVLNSVRGWVDPRAIVRLEGLGQLKNPVTSSGIEPATFRRTNTYTFPTSSGFDGKVTARNTLPLLFAGHAGEPRLIASPSLRWTIYILYILLFHFVRLSPTRHSHLAWLVSTSFSPPVVLYDGRLSLDQAWCRFDG
jgi:hypothetical protein